MLPEKALKNLGLNEKEVRIYLSCLELGPTSVLKIAKKAELKRPTVYTVLETLIDKGLISKVPHKNSFHFAAEPPDKLLSMVYEHERSVQSILPSLKAIDNRSAIKPRVRFYEGREGLLHIYLNEIFQAGEIYFFASIKNWMSVLGKDLMDKFSAASKVKKTKIKELLNHDDRDTIYIKRYLSKLHQIRFLPKDFENKFLFDCAIFKNKIAIVSLKKELFIIVIESEEVADSFRALFDLAWLGAKS